MSEIKKLEREIEKAIFKKSILNTRIKILRSELINRMHEQLHQKEYDTNGTN
jgi:hypothetical protein